MAIEGSTTLKSYFEKGDQPTSAQFSSLIDSAVLIPVSGASAKAGFVEIESSASATAHALGTFNRGLLLDVANTAAARNYLAITSASAGGGGAAGQGILAANATASVVSQFGVLPVANLPDASAAAQGIMEIATTAEVSAAADATRAVTPSNLFAHPGVAKAYADIEGSGGSARTSHNISSVSKGGTGVYTVVFKNPFAAGLPVPIGNCTVGTSGMPVAEPAAISVSSVTFNTWLGEGTDHALTDMSTLTIVVFGVV